MRLVHTIALFSAAATLAVSADAGAVQTPPALARRPVVEVAHGAPVRDAGLLDWYVVPAQHRRAWSRVLATMGPRTWAAWDHDTQVVRRIWGAGVPAPDSLADPAAAERQARAFLAKHLDLLAPGAAVGDFTLVSNHLGTGMRTLGFVQSRGGLPVDGGQISFRFKADRLFMVASEARPHVPAPAAVAVADAAAASAALAWVRADFGRSARVTSVAAPRVLPLIRAGRVDYATVVPVVVDDAPRGRWTVHVDAVTGEPVARVQTLRFAEGTVAYNAPTRGPSSPRMDYPADRADLTVNGQPQTSTNAGKVTWGNNNPASIGAQTVGDLIYVHNDSGPDATTMLNLAPNAVAAWNAANNEMTDAQLAVYTHTNIVKNYIKKVDPNFGWPDQQIDANVNINESCNAFYDGNLNFFREAGGCNNTGRVADIIYHEFGHGVHDNSIIMGVGEFEGALSEGVSDYLSATVTDDPAMGPEFFLGDLGPLRHIDPMGSEAVWPDDIDGDTHITGLIIAGALWDLRKGLIADMGKGPGVAHADHLYYEAIRRSVDIPSMYFEVVAADDDNGNLDDGTPNLCLINTTFAAHGLYKMDIDVTGPGVALPQQAGYDVSASFAAGGGLCAGNELDSAVLTWRLREDPNTGGAIPMDVVGDQIQATIPMQPEGSVVQYQLDINFQNGGTFEYPDNRADPFYEFFVGAVEDIYCTDFENDPNLEGWTHGLSEGQNMEGADDWLWGVPMSPGSSGDPSAAYDGSRVYGNDIGGGQYNGLYQPDKTNWTQTPPIDTTGYGQVRLQYRRWLNVEDGFFDRASIYANNNVVWQNLMSPDMNNATTHHTDREWRFHDVELTDQIVNNSVVVKYEINTDGGLEMGGWTLDSFCVVGVVEAPDGFCGDNIVGVGEDCDDGNNVDGDGCEADCTLPGGETGVDPDTGETGVDPSAGDTGTSAGSNSNSDSNSGTSGDEGSGSGATNPTDAAPTEGGADVTGGSADQTGGADSGGEDTDDGCGCRETPAPSGPLALLALTGLALRRRRR